MTDTKKVPLFRAVAVGASYSDPVRVAAMLIHTEPWDNIIIVGDRHGPLYDNLPCVKTPSELPKIESFDREKRTLVIFDECGEMKGQDLMIMEAFAIRSRLYNVHTLFVECAADMIPEWIRKNTDVLYLTSLRKWALPKLSKLFRNVQAVDGFATEKPNSWLRIDLRNDESEVIDASQYYPE